MTEKRRYSALIPMEIVFTIITLYVMKFLGATRTYAESCFVRVRTTVTGMERVDQVSAG